MNYPLEVFKKYAEFCGRARRSEYWYFELFNVGVLLTLMVLDNFVIGVYNTSGSEIGLLSGMYIIAIIVPSLAVTVRRLHDTDHTGWWVFINIIPIIGPLVLLYFTVQPGQPGTNRFGINPLEEKAT